MPRRNRINSKYPNNRAHTTRDGIKSIKSGRNKREIRNLARELNIPYQEQQQKGN